MANPRLLHGFRIRYRGSTSRWLVSSQHVFYPLVRDYATPRMSLHIYSFIYLPTVSMLMSHGDTLKRYKNEFDVECY